VVTKFALPLKARAKVIPERLSIQATLILPTASMTIAGYEELLVELFEIFWFEKTCARAEFAPAARRRQRAAAQK
jgi:hypothetical protein